MKQKAFLLKSLMVIGLLGCTVSVYAQSYEVDRGRVFFERKPIPYADARTFVDLGCGYAKDCENVYLDGRVLEYVDPATFRLKSHSKSHYRKPMEHRDYDRRHEGYYKSDFNVYYDGKKIDATAATFKEIGEGYAKDSFSVFYHGRKIDASAGSFKLLEGGYAKDAFTVFYFGKKVDGASAGTFKFTGDGYAKDAFNDYYRGQKLE